MVIADHQFVNNNVKYPHIPPILYLCLTMTISTLTAMTLTIPFSVEGAASECTVELRDLGGRTLHTIFHGVCQPGVHSVEFNSENLTEELDAGIYALWIAIGEFSQAYPLQYMP